MSDDQGNGLPGWSPLLGIPMPTQVVCHPDDEDRMRAALAADPIWAKVELIANPVVGRGVLLLVDQRATAVHGEPVPPDYEHAVTQQRFCCDTVRGSEHLRHCPFAYRPLEPVGPVRYGQCDAICTTDCGHCKGQGIPVSRSGATDREVEAPTEFDVAAVMLAMGMPLERELHQLIEPTREKVLRLAGLIVAARAAAAPDSGQDVEVLAERLQQADPNGVLSALTNRPVRWHNPHVDHEHYRKFAAALLAEQPGGGR